MRLHRSSRALALLLTLGLSAGATACASGGGSGDSGPRRNPNLITADELANYSTLSALDVVRQLRPRWLQPRGGAGLPTVMMDGARLGPPDNLASISVNDLESSRYLTASDATMRYGTNFTGGAIEVVSRAR